MILRYTILFILLTVQAHAGFTKSKTPTQHEVQEYSRLNKINNRDSLYNEISKLKYLHMSYKEVIMEDSLLLCFFTVSKFDNILLVHYKNTDVQKINFSENAWLDLWLDGGITDKSGHPKDSILNEKEYSTMVQDLKSIYDTTFHYTNWIHGYMNMEIFGTAIGAHGEPCKALTSAIDFYKKDEIDTLIKWLKSPYEPVKQLSAVLVLEYHINKYNLTMKSVQRIISYVKEKEKEIRYRSGCTHSGTISMKQAMKSNSDFLASYFKRNRH